MSLNESPIRSYPVTFGVVFSAIDNEIPSSRAVALPILAKPVYDMMQHEC